MNMSYCRFYNTLQDLKDCWYHIEELSWDMSDDEFDARKKLIQLCQDIAQDADYLLGLEREEDV